MIKSNCEHCGKEREYKYKSHVKRFCSHTCARYGEKREEAPKVKITCVCCNKEFELLESVKRAREKQSGKEIKYCSVECYGKDHRTRKEVECLKCGTKFETTRNKFCSRECHSKYRIGKSVTTRKKFMTVKGFWFENGYKVIYAGGGKGIKEHIKVMEQHIGRKLEKNEIVHHINEVRTDNRIENLQLMTRSEHSSLHRRLELERGKKLFGKVGAVNE